MFIVARGLVSYAWTSGCRLRGVRYRASRMRALQARGTSLCATTIVPRTLSTDSRHRQLTAPGLWARLTKWDTASRGDNPVEPSPRRTDRERTRLREPTRSSLRTLER